MAQRDLQIRVLGPISASLNGTQADLGGRRQRTLLAALAVDDGAIVSAERLAERLWGDEARPADPRASLHTYLSRLRQALEVEGAIETSSLGWQLNDRVVEVDAARFAGLVDAAEEPGVDVHQRLGLLDEALGLWRGEAFDDVAGEEWVRAEAQRLNELRVTVIERRYDAMLSAGMHTDALPGLVGEAEAHPLRDRLVSLQMLALFRSGRQAEATRVFQVHRERLAGELGLEPGADLVDLDRRILAGDPSLLLSETPGRVLRGYRLGEQLGEGAFAVVYRGTQPSVGRDVAVKVIRSELANRPEFVRRFEAEAHLVARLEHPFIVPLYDYWREPDRACLVFRYLRGGTLEQRLSSSGGLSVEECQLLVDEVGAALSVAHGAGVVHRDVKPANVFLDEAGNFYLGDFGIALEASELSDPTAALSAGSPAYASPEQLRREPIGPSADVHGLGISIYEALTGRLPFPSAISQADLLRRQLYDPIPLVGDRRKDIPTAVDEVLARATAKDPDDRFQTVEELVAEFTAALDGRPAAVLRLGAATTVSTSETRNPYKGLRAFTEADSADFFGRERLVDRLVEVLGRRGTEGRIAAVVGPSGIGKSSVVRAGLLPALRRGAVTGSDRWFVATMLPGRDPFDELAAALLRVATRAPDNMMGQLAEDHRGIARVVKAMAPADDLGDVLLVIDQFEELFTLSDDDTVTRLFLDSLEHALTDARCPLRVVLTMRADFWDRPLRHGSFARLIDASTVNVTALAPDELERAITEPAHRAGAEFEPGLVSEIVADLTDQPGALPLLQYALTELWEQQISGLLTRDAYHQLDGVAGALTRRAEDLYREATPEEQAAIRPLFGRLVAPGEGTEDTRRRALLTEFGTSDAVDPVIDRYGAARLLSFDTDPTTREPTVEVAHEALIRQWPRLRHWLDEDRDNIRIHRHLNSVATEWDKSGRPAAELYRGGRLEAAEEWVVGRSGELNTIEHRFLSASVELHASEQAAEQERFERQAKDNRRLKVLLSSVAIVAVLALIAGTVAFQERGRANDKSALAEASEQEALRQAEAAEIRRLVSDSALQREANPTISMLLAVEANQRQPGPLTDGGLLTALQRSDGYLGLIDGPSNIGNINFIGLLGDDAVIVRDLDEISIYSLTDRSLTYRIQAGSRQNEANRTTVVTHLDLAITVTDDGRALLFDAATIGAGPVDVSGDIAASGVGLGADGSVLIGSENGEVLRLDPVTGGRMRVAQHPYPIQIATSSADGRFVAVVDEGRNATLWSVDSGEALWTWTRDGLVPGGPLTLPPIEDDPLSPSGENLWFSNDGRYLYTDRNGLEALKLEDGAPAWNVGSRQDGNSRRFQELGDGSLIYGSLVVEDGEVVRVLEQFNITDMIAISPSERLMVQSSVGDASGLRLWSADGTQLIAHGLQRGDHDYATLDVDANKLASFRYANPDDTYEAGTVRLVRTGDVTPTLDNPAWFQVFTRHGDALSYYLDSPDIEPDRTSLFRDPEAFEPLAAPIPPQAWGAAELSPDGRFVAIGDHQEAEIRVYEASTAKLIATLNEPLDPTGRCGCFIGFSPDSSLIAATSVVGGAAIWSTETWKPVALVEPSDADLYSVTFSRDGGQLLTSSVEGVIYAYALDTDDTETIGVVPFNPGTYYHGVAIAESPDGEYLVTAGDSVALVHRDTGSIIGTQIDKGELIGASASLDGEHAVTASEEHLLVWNLRPDTWPDIACMAAGRNMTAEEWQQYGPPEEYRATCPQWPAQR